MKVLLSFSLLLAIAGCSGGSDSSGSNTNNNADSTSDASAEALSPENTSDGQDSTSEQSSEEETTSQTLVLEEATGFCSVDGVVDNTDSSYSDFSGDGIANTDNASGKGIEWRFSSPSRTSVALSWRFLNDTDTEVYADLFIDDNYTDSLTFPANATDWGNLTLTVPISAGENQIRLQASSDTGLPLVDSMTVTSSEPLVAVDCSSGLVDSDSDSGDSDSDSSDSDSDSGDSDSDSDGSDSGSDNSDSGSDDSDSGSDDSDSDSGDSDSDSSDSDSGSDGSDSDNGDSDSDSDDSDSGSDDSGSDDTGSEDDTADGWFACDDDSIVYDIIISSADGTTYQVFDSSHNELWSGMEYADAYRQAYANMRDVQVSEGKTRILITADGTISATDRVVMWSNSVINVCATVNVAGTPESAGDSPFYAANKSGIDIPNLTLTGTPANGIFLRNVDDVRLGNITMELSPDSWAGIRIDNHPSAGTYDRVTNITIDTLYIEYSGAHALETFGVDGFTMGSFTGHYTGKAGVLLNDTVNADIETINCNECAYIERGYAAFRTANGNGEIDGEYPAGNVHVGSIYARGGGRGIFSLYASGGLTIDNLDLADQNNDSILLQNAYNVTLAASSGSVATGRIYISNDVDNTVSGNFAVSSNVTISNITLGDEATIEEAWCDYETPGDQGNRAHNISGGAGISMCYQD